MVHINFTFSDLQQPKPTRHRIQSREQELVLEWHQGVGGLHIKESTLGQLIRCQMFQRLDDPSLKSTDVTERLLTWCHTVAVDTLSCDLDVNPLLVQDSCILILFQVFSSGVAMSTLFIAAVLIALHALPSSGQGRSQHYNVLYLCKKIWCLISINKSIS